MPKYIELEPLIEEITSCKKTLKQCIDDAPRVDAVPVVRCMHCIHLRTSINKENYCDLHSSVWYKFYVRVDDFCSYGERKEVANNG